ncbi:MAG: hypothetical protein ACXWP4_27470 [Polyangiales bacterium]
MPSTVDDPSSKNVADDDGLPTTRMPTIQPPPLPAFSPQQIFASLHTDPTPNARSTSWNTKPGSWWPSLTKLVERRERPSVIVPATPPTTTTRWTQAQVGLLASITGVAIVVVALLGASLDLAFSSTSGARDGFAIAVVVGRLVVALAFAAFGWGLIRLGERLALR